MKWNKKKNDKIELIQLRTTIFLFIYKNISSSYWKEGININMYAYVHINCEWSDSKYNL